MLAEDCLRLAWEADRDGRRKLRESLLTLAVVEGGPDDRWAERCRARLVSDRPEHYLAGFSNVRLALADPRVIEARERLRSKYPGPRVSGLLLTARSARGPFTGRAESLDAMIDDLAGPAAEAENVRRDVAQLARGPLAARVRSLRSVGSAPVDPGWSRWDGPDEPPGARVVVGRNEDIAHFYVSVLIAIAMLIATTDAGSKGRDAA